MDGYDPILHDPFNDIHADCWRTAGLIDNKNWKTDLCGPYPKNWPRGAPRPARQPAPPRQPRQPAQPRQPRQRMQPIYQPRQTRQQSATYNGFANPFGYNPYNPYAPPARPRAQRAQAYPQWPGWPAQAQMTRYKTPQYQQAYNHPAYANHQFAQYNPYAQSWPSAFPGFYEPVKKPKDKKTKKSKKSSKEEKKSSKKKEKKSSKKKSSKK